MTPRKETEPTKEPMPCRISPKGYATETVHHRVEICQCELARRDEARDAALLKPWREAAKFLKTRHSAYCSTVECNCSPHESAINSLIALLSQPAAEEARP